MLLPSSTECRNFCYGILPRIGDSGGKWAESYCLLGLTAL